MKKFKVKIVGQESGTVMRDTGPKDTCAVRLTVDGHRFVFLAWMHDSMMVNNLIPGGLLAEQFYSNNFDDVREAVLDKLSKWDKPLMIGNTPHEIVYRALN